jgi:transcriptional regulator with XRE-family HTH domain
MKVKIGEFLRLKRLEKRLSQSDIAERVGVSTNYISEIEKGNKTNPSDEIILKLAEVFNLDEDDLFPAFNKLPLPARDEIEAYPSLAKAISQLNSDETLSPEKKKQFYDKLVYWYKKIAEEDRS